VYHAARTYRGDGKQTPETRQSSPTRPGCGGTCNQSAAATRFALTCACSSPGASIWSATEPVPATGFAPSWLEYFPALEGSIRLRHGQGCGSAPHEVHNPGRHPPGRRSPHHRLAPQPRLLERNDNCAKAIAAAQAQRTTVRPKKSVLTLLPLSPAPFWTCTTKSQSSTGRSKPNSGNTSKPRSCSACLASARSLRPNSSPPPAETSPHTPVQPGCLILGPTPQRPLGNAPRQHPLPTTSFARLNFYPFVLYALPCRMQG
jgi:hypothetical protein